jgi:hypothetical protein
VTVRPACSPAGAGLTALATYTEGGAFFYLLTVGWLFLSARRPPVPTRRPKETTIMPSRRDVLGLGAAALSVLALTGAGRPGRPAVAPPTVPVRPPFALQPATVPAGYVCDC